MANFRQAAAADAAAIHRLISANLEAGHLLPRTLDDVVTHASRFLVADNEGVVVGCAELAPLSPSVAEVRSLVVDEPARGQQIGPRLVAALAAEAASRGFATLCAFTHEPSHFVRLEFSIVPHIWVPEKIAHDCRSCPLFRRCGQYAVTLALRAGVHVRPEQPAAVIFAGRGAAGPRPNVERLQFQSSGAPARTPRTPSEVVPA
jgi:amino-acid N-acetyltransferase